MYGLILFLSLINIPKAPLGVFSLFGTVHRSDKNVFKSVIVRCPGGHGVGETTPAIVLEEEHPICNIVIFFMKCKIVILQ